MNLDDLYRLLRGAHVQAQGVVDTVRDPLLVLDSQLHVLSANPAFYRTFNVDQDATLDLPIYELGSGQWNIEELRDLLERVIPKSASVLDYEVRADFPEIGERTMLITAQRLTHPDDNSRVLLLTIIDATERRRREEEKDLLISELRHRMKNVLALTQALARQTTASGRSGEEYRDVFLGRFRALAASLDVSMTNETADLSDLARRALEPYAGDGAVIDVEESPAVSLKAGQVLSVNMILHELAANAAKHGALSAPAGRVRIGWSLLEEDEGVRRVSLWWRETGGPKVSPPTRCGFGTRLIGCAAERDLGGKVELDYAPEGFQAKLSFPL